MPDERRGQCGGGDREEGARVAAALAAQERDGVTGDNRYDPEPRIRRCEIVTDATLDDSGADQHRLDMEAANGSFKKCDRDQSPGSANGTGWEQGAQAGKQEETGRKREEPSHTSVLALGGAVCEQVREHSRDQGELRLKVKAKDS